jgi:hypothetical protein
MMRRSLVAAVFAVSACSQDPAPCDPGSAGLGGAPAAQYRIVTPAPALNGCPSQTQAQVAHDAAGLQGLYDTAASADAGSSMPPAVDFSRETAVVITSTGNEGVAWAVVQGDVLTVGLRGCSSYVGVCNAITIAVSGNVSRAATHECEGVTCF